MSLDSFWNLWMLQSAFSVIMKAWIHGTPHSTNIAPIPDYLNIVPEIASSDVCFQQVNTFWDYI